jgi:hypothetical protein
VEVPEAPVIEEEDRPHKRFVELVVTTRLTVPENPLTGATVMVELPVLSRFIVRLAGLAVTVKSGEDDCTMAEMLVEWMSEPLVTVIVTL